MNTPICIRLSMSVILIILLSFGCQKSTDAQLEAVEKARIIQAIETQVWAFHEADTSRNADKVVSLLWPECSMLIDGNRISYQDISKGSREFMNGIVEFNTEWSDLEIIPVSENVAISSFIFKDSIIDKSGNLKYSQGPNTFLWQKRNGEWRVLYGDADHYQLNLGN